MNNAVLLEKKEGVAIVTLNRPDRLNAVNDEIRAGLKEKLDEPILEKPVFPRLTEVVLDRTFDIKNAQKSLDENGFNVGLFDSGFAYHINSRGVDKGSGLIKALEMLNADLEDTIALGDSETDVPLFQTVKNNIAVNNSIPELKEIAKIVTTKNSGEGVLEGLDMIKSEF